MKIEIQSRGQMPEAEHKQMNHWLDQAFGHDELVIEWANDDWLVLVKYDDQIVSHVGIVERVGAVSGQPVKLGGVGGVATHPEYRRRGLAQAAMEKAAEFMRDELRVEFGLLICGGSMLPYYARLGWQSVEEPLMFDQPNGKVTFDKLTKVMILPCTKQAWPLGVIDLCGPPW
jgi:aminoglycoside 2'-N-acetyltransferase I